MEKELALCALTIAARDAEVAVRDAEIAAEVAARDAEVAARDAEIAELRAQHREKGCSCQPMPFNLPSPCACA